MPHENAVKLAEMIIGVIGPGANINVKESVFVAKHTDETYSITGNAQPRSGLDSAAAIQVVAEILTT